MKLRRWKLVGVQGDGSESPIKGRYFTHRGAESRADLTEAYGNLFAFGRVRRWRIEVRRA